MFRIVKPNKQKPFTIGRKEGSDLHFPERFVSREHAIIECKETASGCEWHIRSLTTNSFTLLNDVQVTESESHDGDIIGIGVKQMRANLKDGELSLLLFDANDEVERIELEDTPTTREIDDEGSKNEIQFRAYENGAEIQFRHAVTDEKGKRYKKIVLGENETTRYDQTEITAKDGALLLRKASVGFDIHVRNLDVFTGKKQLLSGIDFDLPAGEILAIIGRSGQGKSSLLKLFEGIYRKGEQSEVHIGGVDYRCKKIREHIAILAQDPPLRGDLTVDETLRHGARIAMDSHDFRKNAEGRSAAANTAASPSPQNSWATRASSSSTSLSRASIRSIRASSART